MAKNIEMNVLTEGGNYEILYPNVQAKSVIDFSGDNPLLSESTASLYSGLSSNPDPDEVFSVLSKSVLYQDGEMVTTSNLEIPTANFFWGKVIVDTWSTATLQFVFPLIPDVWGLFLHLDKTDEGTYETFVCNLPWTEKIAEVFFLWGDSSRKCKLTYTENSVTLTLVGSANLFYKGDYYFWGFKGTIN